MREVALMVTGGFQQNLLSASGAFGCVCVCVRVFVCARHKAEERRGKCFYREGQL